MIDPIFNMYKIKFDTLDKLNPLDNTKSKVRVYVNLEMVLKTLITQRNSNQLQASGDTNGMKLCIISNIINLAQHYRLYCVKHGKQCEVFVYFNYPHGIYYNTEFIVNYRSYYVDRVLKNENAHYLESNLNPIIDFLKILYKYVEGVYIINSSKIESSVLPYLISKNSQDIEDEWQNIIVSNNKYDLQYVNHNFTILSPYGDTSSVITQNNAIMLLKSFYDVATPIDVSPMFIPFITSLLGDKYRCIPKIRGVGLASILKIIKDGLTSKEITFNTSNMMMLRNIIKSEYQEMFDTNYQCVDIELQYHRISDAEVQHIIEMKEDKFDEKALERINEAYFSEHPIMIINPKTEQIRNKRYSNKSIFG